MLSKSVRIEPDFLSTTGVTEFKNLGLIVSRDLMPLADMLKVARLLWLGALFWSWKQKKEQYFFKRLAGNNLAIGAPSFKQNRPAFVKSLEPALSTRLESLPFRSSFASRCARRGRIRLGFIGNGTIFNKACRDHAWSLMGWIGISWGKCRNGVGITPFKDVVFHLLEKTGHQFCNLQKLHSADICSVISTFDQANIYSVGGINCQLQ